MFNFIYSTIVLSDANQRLYSIEAYKQGLLKASPQLTKEEFEKNIRPLVEHMFIAHNALLTSPKIRLFFIFNGCLGLITIILGIGLVRLRELARKATMIFFMLGVVLIPLLVNSFIVTISEIMSRHSPQLSAQQTIASAVLPILWLIQITFIGLIAAGVACYLVRPLVKEQFR
ncbi:hypothetical protein ACFL1I_06430 [Candidatus Omnitrophota bacterium]